MFDSLIEELPFTHLSEEDFRLAMFEQLNGYIRYDPDRLAGLRFNPLLSETYKKFSLCSDHDPDANFLSESADCEYYIEEKLNEILCMLFAARETVENLFPDIYALC